MQTTAAAETNAQSILRADLFVSADGTFAVVWQYSETIKLQWYNANGSPQRAAMAIATNLPYASLGSTHLQIAGDSAGNLLVVHNVGNYFAEDIWALSVARDGTVTRAPWQVNTNTVGPQKNPTVALNVDGVGVIAWSDFGDASVGQPVQTVARQVWNYGLQNRVQIIVSPYARMDRFFGSNVNLAGEFVIAFYVDETSIFVQNFSAAGAAIGVAFRANSFLGTYGQDPSISLNDAGWMAVAWDNWRQDGTANNGVGVYSQLFDPSGNRYGPEFAVPVERDHEQALASVVLDKTGRLHFTWTNGGYLNPVHDTVETRLFDVKLPPVIVPNQSFKIAENLPAGTVVGMVAAADPNPNSVVSFEMTSFSGFSIDPVTGVIKTTGPLDFETRNTFALDIRVTSNDGIAVSVVTVRVTNVNEVPTTVSLQSVVNSLPENSNTSAAIKVADNFVADDALGTNVLALTGLHAGSFVIVGNGLFLKSGITLDSEALAMLSLTVRVDDSTIGSTPDATTNYSLSITDVNESFTWHNAAKPMDTNNDGLVKPVDALIVINYLNSRLPRTVAPGSTPTRGFLDTSKDNIISPLDALLVINALNTRASGDGEGAIQVEVKVEAVSPRFDWSCFEASDDRKRQEELIELLAGDSQYETLSQRSR